MSLDLVLGARALGSYWPLTGALSYGCCALHMRLLSQAQPCSMVSSAGKTQQPGEQAQGVETHEDAVVNKNPPSHATAAAGLSGH